jgi:hypothetical protein
MLVSVFTREELKNLASGSVLREGQSGAVAKIERRGEIYGKVVFYSNRGKILSSHPIPYLRNNDLLIVTCNDITGFLHPDLNTRACLNSGHFPPKTTRVPYGQRLRDALVGVVKSELTDKLLNRAKIMIKGVENALKTRDLDLKITEAIHVTLSRQSRVDEHKYSKYFRFLPQPLHDPKLYKPRTEAEVSHENN